MELVAIAFLVFLAVPVIAATWRFATFRNSGAQGVIRRLPATGIHGWRHGIVRYRGEELEFFKLRSLSFTHDLAFARRDMTIESERKLSNEECEFMPGVESALTITCGGESFEFAGDRRAQMALISWVEAAPDRRQVRRDVSFQALQAYQAHDPGRGKA